MTQWFISMIRKPHIIWLCNPKSFFGLAPGKIKNLISLLHESYQIELRWDNESNSKYYLIYKNITGNPAGSENAQPIDKTNHTKYVDNNVIGSMTYFYAVVGVDVNGEMGQPSDDIKLRTPLDPILDKVASICGSIALTIFLVSFLYPVDFKDFSIAFDGSLIYNDKGISILIENVSPTKTFSIFGLDSQSMNVSVSNMASIDGNLIEHKYILLNGSPGSASAKSSNNILSISLKISTEEIDISPGSYQEFLFIEGRQYSAIPIAISTPTDIMRAIGFITVGILTSIIIWETIKYLKKNNDEKTKYLLLSESRRDLESGKESEAKYLVHIAKAMQDQDRLRVQIAQREQRDRLSASDPNYRGTAEYEEKLYKSIVSNKRLAAGFKTQEKIAADSATSKGRAASLKDIQVAGYRNRAKAVKGLATRIGLTELVIGTFGIAVAVLALPNNEYVTGLRTFDLHAILVLFGIGLGIGSLKEIVDK